MGLTTTYEFIVGFVVASSYVVLIAVFLLQELRHTRLVRRMLAREQDLLNRLMSRDFGEYAAAQRALPVDWKLLSDYTRVAKREQADDEERREDGGLPVT